MLMTAVRCDMRVRRRCTQIQTCRQAQTRVYGDGDITLRSDAVCTHATVSMVTYKQRYWQFRLGRYTAPAGSSSKLIMERSPCRSTGMCVAASLAELALPSTLAAGHLGRARGDKHIKMLCDSIWQQLCMQAWILLG